MKDLLNPKSIAVIGASREPGKIGQIIVDNLSSNPGLRIYPINPNASEILGITCFKSILDVKDHIDLAIICVPAKIAPKVIESCGKKGVSTAIIISAGFSESGKSGAELEKEILSIAKRHQIRLLGPNCLGVINNFSNINASFATAKLPNKYRVGIFSQSGAMGAAMLDFANGQNFGFSYFVSLGNKTDISETDLLLSWANDKNVEVAVGYLEDIKNGPEFLAAAKKFTQKKPLIILKGGTTREGNKAARLHTAALAQDERVFEAAAQESGVTLARNLSDLFELAVSFSQNPLPKGKNLAIISNAGGPSVLAADAVDQESLGLASLSAISIYDILKNTMAASAENPIDLRGDATAKDFEIAIEVALKDKKVDGILVIATPQAMTEIEEIAWRVVAAQKKSKKPIYANFLGGEIVEKSKNICTENSVPSFTYPERAVRAFRYQADFYLRKFSVHRKQPKHSKHHVARSIIKFSDRDMAPERISALLNLYDIPMARTVLAQNKKEAIKALEKVGLPVAMKISSPGILHKTDVGGVVLGVKSPAEAEKAFEKIISNVKRNRPNDLIKGVTVMEMAKEGLELIIGAKRDSIFGPVLIFGFGGIFVELISDFSVSVGPFTEEKIKAMIKRTKVSKIIEGYRHNSKYDEAKLISILYGLGQLITDHEEISSIEINPLVMGQNGSGAIGLDAKIELNNKSR
jgi:acetyltransferase